MISKKFPVLIVFALVLSLFAGCSSYRGEQASTNYAGIYEQKTMGYDRVPSTTIPLRRADVDPGAEYTGNQTSILWGLFTYYDY